MNTSKHEIEYWDYQRKRCYEHSLFINPSKWTKQLPHLFRSYPKYQKVEGSRTKDIKGGS